MSTKDARVNVRIEGEMEEWMKEVAKAEGISVSAVARRILINIPKESGRRHCKV